MIDALLTVAFVAALFAVLAKLAGVLADKFPDDE